MIRGIPIIACLFMVSACSGPSNEELRRVQLLQAQQAEQTAINTQLETEARQTRVQQRTTEAHTAWQKKIRLNDQKINTLFSASAADQIEPDQTYFVQFDLQPAKYNYNKNTQNFTIVGMRNLPDSAVYGPLFPDDQAQYQPGQLAESVLEFALKEQTERNRLGQLVLQSKGQRWVAATLNFKTYETLNDNNDQWSWEPGLFDDIAWEVTPEAAYPYTSGRSLVLQMGMRFCLLDRCTLNSDYRKHPTHAIRTEIISMLVADQKSGAVMAEFIREKE